ncbi:MAG: hypothetical protein AAFQ82_20680, partial [Myxococcota bacterium]
MSTRRTTGVFLESVGEVVSESAATSVRWFPVILVHALAAVALSYPVILSLSKELPLASGDTADSLYRNLFILRWQAERLAHFYSGYWEAPLHFPHPSAFAFFDGQPLSGAMFAGVRAMTRSPVVAFNSVILVLLTFNGVAFSALARAVKTGWAGAVAVGLLGQASPIALANLSDPTALVSFPLVFAIASLGRFSVTGELRWAVALGLCGVLAFGTSTALFFAMVMTLPFLALVLLLRARPVLSGVQLTGVVAVFLGLLAYPLWRQWNVLGSHTRAELALLSVQQWLR